MQDTHREATGIALVDGAHDANASGVPAFVFVDDVLAIGHPGHPFSWEDRKGSGYAWSRADEPTLRLALWGEHNGFDARCSMGQKTNSVRAEGFEPPSGYPAGQ
jgi:hypothetical protein